MVPKLFINADPGSFLTGAQREFCRSWPNQEEVTGKGIHFAHPPAQNGSLSPSLPLDLAMSGKTPAVRPSRSSPDQHLRRALVSCWSRATARIQQRFVPHRWALLRWGFHGAMSVLGDATHPVPGMADGKLPSLPHLDGGSRWLAGYARQRHSSARRSLRRQESAWPERSSEPVRALPPT